MKSLLSTIAFVLAVSLLTGAQLCSATLRAVSETPTLDGVDNGDWSGTAIITGNNVRMKAAYDHGNIYVLAQWNDATSRESVFKDHWTFDGTGWSQSADEDRIAIMWDLGTSPNGAACTSMCHPPRMYTDDGTVDVWNWKATRTNPMGYADDEYIIAIQDTSAGGKTRFGDAGTSAFSGNYGGSVPLSQAVSDPNSNIHFLLFDADAQAAFDPYGVMNAHPRKQTVAFVNSGWTAGSTVAGYIHDIPDGSRADVHAAGLYDNGVWTVEFARSLTTSAPGDDTSDVQFDLASSYNFSVGLFDNSGGSSHETDPTEHVLVFESAGVGDGGGGSVVPMSLALSQNYPNPFNPSTAISYVVPEMESAEAAVELQVFTIHGQLVRTLVRKSQPAGSYAVYWNGEDQRGLELSSGIYVYRLNVGGRSVTRKMTLLK